MHSESRIKFEEGDIEYFDTAMDLPDDLWDDNFDDDQVLMKKASLLALEKGSQFTFIPSYFLFRKGELIIPFYFQQYPLSKSTIGEILNLNGWANAFTSLLLQLGNGISGKNYNLLVCGNILASGSPGFPVKFLSQKVNLDKAFIDSFIPYLKQHNPLLGDPFVVLYKDLDATKNHFFDRTTLNKNVKLPLEPFMSMEIDKNWNTFDDYLNSLSSKYRVGAKSTIKKFDQITSVEFEVEDITACSSHIDELYSKVEERAKIRLSKVNPSYFSEMKKVWGDQFVFRVFLLKDKPLAFTSALYLNDQGDAHLIGFDDQNNQKFSLYHNLLFTFIDDGIKNKVKRLNFGRTAPEIKSSVGATTEATDCFVVFSEQNFGSLANRAVSRMSEGQYNIRHPFRKNS